MTTRVGRALIEELDNDDLVELADRLTPFLLSTFPSTGESRQGADGWLDSKRAAAHLGVTVGALHKLKSAGAIPFEQDGPGCKCWYWRADLDRWRRGGGRAEKDYALQLAGEHGVDAGGPDGGAGGLLGVSAAPARLRPSLPPHPVAARPAAAGVQAGPLP